MSTISAKSILKQARSDASNLGMALFAAKDDIAIGTRRARDRLSRALDDANNDLVEGKDRVGNAFGATAAAARSAARSYEQRANERYSDVAERLQGLRDDVNSTAHAVFAGARKQADAASSRLQRASTETAGWITRNPYVVLTVFAAAGYLLVRRWRQRVKAAKSARRPSTRKPRVIRGATNGVGRKPTIHP